MLTGMHTHIHQHMEREIITRVSIYLSKIYHTHTLTHAGVCVCIGVYACKYRHVCVCVCVDAHASVCTCVWTCGRICQQTDTAVDGSDLRPVRLREGHSFSLDPEAESRSPFSSWIYWSHVGKILAPLPGFQDLEIWSGFDLSEYFLSGLKVGM